MTKAEFVDRIAGDFDSKKSAADAVEAVLDAISDTLAGGGDVNFTGFGKFSVARDTKGRPMTYSFEPGATG